MAIVFPDIQYRILVIGREMPRIASGDETGFINLQACCPGNHSTKHSSFGG
jgi:hypothetical protein